MRFGTCNGRPLFRWLLAGLSSGKCEELIIMGRGFGVGVWGWYEGGGLGWEWSFAVGFFVRSFIYSFVHSFALNYPHPSTVYV